MQSVLIKDTTRRQRQEILRRGLGQGCSQALCRLYIDGLAELEEIRRRARRSDGRSRI